MIKFKRFTAALVTCALLVTLTACGSDQGVDKAPEGKAVPVRLVLDYTPNTNHTGIYVARDKGYYAEEGIDLTIDPPPQGGATGLVAAGKADFGIDFQDLLAPAFARAEPLAVTAVATLIQHNTSALMSLAKKEIKTPKDMEGKTYGTWNNPVEQAMIRDPGDSLSGDS